MIFSFGFVFTNYFPHCFEKSTEEMAEDNKSIVKSVNHHPTKIDIVKFDGINNFGM